MSLGPTLFARRLAVSATASVAGSSSLALVGMRATDGRSTEWRSAVESRSCVSGQIIRSGVNPTPPHTLQSWEVATGRHVVAVELEHVATPPALTSSGQVYERVAGETVPVRDPTRVAALFEKGEAARARAEASSEDAATMFVAPDVLSATLPGILDIEPEQVCFGLAISATAYQEDIASRLFTPAFEDRLAEAARVLSGTPENHPFAPHTEPMYRQDSMLVRITGPTIAGYPATSVVGGFWNGTGAVWWVSTTEVALSSLIAHKVTPAWRLATEFVEALGGFGPARLALAVPGTPQLYDGPSDDIIVVKRHVDLRPPDEDEVASVDRELRRSGGHPVHEPGV